MPLVFFYFDKLPTDFHCIGLVVSCIVILNSFSSDLRDETLDRNELDDLGERVDFLLSFVVTENASSLPMHAGQSDTFQCPMSVFFAICICEWQMQHPCSPRMGETDA